MTRRQRLPTVVAHLPKSRAALEYAKREHAGQRRSSDGTPFIEHPFEVGWLLYRGGAPDHVIAAGVLHDILEKTAVSAAELSKRFGLRVAMLVQAVSEDAALHGYAKRKAALRRQVAVAGPEALTIFAADKVSKVRELHGAIRTATRQGERIDESLIRPRRLAHYRRCLGLLEERLTGSPLVEQLRADLADVTYELETQRETRAIA